MAWTHNNWRNASFNPHKKDDRLLASTVTAVRQHKVAKPIQEEQKKDDVSLDLVDVLNRPPSGRVKWLQKGLLFVATKGKSQITALYDIVLHRRFVTDISVELARQMLELLNSNLHLFSVKQKQVLEVKLNMLGDFLAQVSDDEDSDSEEEEPAVAERAASRSSSASPERAPNGSTAAPVQESTAPEAEADEADSASTAKCAANAAAAAAFASAAKVVAAAAQEAAAAAAAAPAVAPSAGLTAAPTTEDAFPSQSKASRSRSTSLHGKDSRKDKETHKEKDKEKKRNRTRSRDGSLDKKKKRKKSRSRSKKKSRSRSRKRSQSRSKKKSRSRSKKKSQSRSRRKSRSHSKKKSRSRSKKKSRSRSKKKSRSRSKAKRKGKAASSSSSTSRSRQRRSSPKRAPGDSSIWLPPPMSGKEAVASGGREEELAPRSQSGNPVSGAQIEARRPGEKLAPGTNPQLRPGDWFCPLCGAHNYSSKSQCFRCVKAPPSNPSSVPSAAAQPNMAFSAPMPPPSGTGSMMPQGDSLRQAQLNAARRLAAVPSPAAPVRSGDWFCSVCNAHNFASKSKCFRCMQGKNPRMSGGMM